ncbi:MAG: UDP-glucuronic acid decarboxylase family protein [candidate division WOR-3 bacterium]
MKKVLITGVAGFIGSHLAERFIREGYFVYGVDNFLTGRRENIAHLSSENFTLIEWDLRTPFTFDFNELDMILHFASPASPVDYFRYPIETLEVNSIGTLSMLKLALKVGALFVFASTSEVYGDPEVHPQGEDYWGHVNPVGPRSVYDEGKRFGEALTMGFYRKYGLKTRILRIFNTYGPRMRIDDGRVIPSFIGRALKGEPLIIYGDGTQTRSYCYVDDLVEGIYLVATKSDINGEVINLGNPEEYTILETAKIILELTGSRSKIIFESGLEDDPKRRRPDITKAINLLGWRPKTPFIEGLGKTIEYFASILK